MTSPMRPLLGLRGAAVSALEYAFAAGVVVALAVTYYLPIHGDRRQR